MEPHLYSGHYAPAIVKGDQRTAEQQVGHKVDVYQFGNLQWVSWNDKFMQPAGKLEKVFSVDLGELAAELYKLRNPGRSLERSKIILPPQFQHIAEYLTLEARRHDHSLWYSFDVNRDAVSLERPLEYRITQYALVDNELIELQDFWIMVQARRDKKSKKPLGSFSLRRYQMHPSASASDLNFN